MQTNILHVAKIVGVCEFPGHINITNYSQSASYFALSRKFTRKKKG